MNSYSKVGWTNNSGTPLNATNLNKMDDQILEVTNTLAELIRTKEDKSSKVTEIPASPVSGTYPTTGAVKSFVEGKGYLTQHQDISGKANIADIPTKTSQLTNDSGFLTHHQDISGKADKLPVGTSEEIVNANGNGEIQRSGYRISTNKNFIADRDSANSVVPNARAVAQYVEGKGYLTQHQDISGKADASSVYTKTQTDDKIYEGIDDTLSETDSSTVPRLTIAQHNGAYWLTYFDSEHNAHYLYDLTALIDSRIQAALGQGGN